MQTSYQLTIRFGSSSRSVESADFTGRITTTEATSADAAPLLWTFGNGNVAHRVPFVFDPCACCGQRRGLHGALFLDAEGRLVEVHVQTAFDRGEFAFLRALGDDAWSVDRLDRGRHPCDWKRVSVSLAPVSD